jgi:hypothetical protein
MSEVLTKIVIDCATGISTEVPLTAEEITQQEEMAAAFAEQQASAEAEAAQKAADKADAIAALVALGLTEAQISALTGN